MATKTPKTSPRAAEPQEEAESEQEAQQSQAEPHPPTEARKTAPIAPKATSGNSPQVILAIRHAIAEALYSKHPEAVAAGIEKVEKVATTRAHPSVAAYKAEALDYLRGKL